MQNDMPSVWVQKLVRYQRWVICKTDGILTYFCVCHLFVTPYRSVWKCWENTKISWSGTYRFPIKVAVFLGTPIYPPFLHKPGHDFFGFSPTLVTNLGLSENVGEKANILIWLVVSTPLKNISQFVLRIVIPNIWKNEKCSKPPSSDGQSPFAPFFQWPFHLWVTLKVKTPSPNLRQASAMDNKKNMKPQPISKWPDHGELDGTVCSHDANMIIWIMCINVHLTVCLCINVYKCINEYI